MTDWQRDLDDAQATIEELTRERDGARAEASGMRPVVEAARTWFANLAKSDLSPLLARDALVEAIAAYAATHP